MPNNFWTRGSTFSFYFGPRKYVANSNLHYTDPPSILFHTSEHIHIPLWEAQKEIWETGAVARIYQIMEDFLCHAMELERYLIGDFSAGE